MGNSAAELRSSAAEGIVTSEIPMPTTTLGPHTVKDWFATPEGKHWELIHGNLVMTEESFGNSRLAWEIGRKIEDYLDSHPSGIVGNNIAFVFPGVQGTENGLVPDLCYIPKSELSKVDSRENAQKGVIPALVAEMLSPSTKEIDLVDKVEIYRAAGVSEYWIFDLEEGSVRIYRFAESPEEPVAVKAFKDTLTTPLFPGFSLELPQVRQALAIGGNAPRQRRMR